MHHIPYLFRVIATVALLLSLPTPSRAQMVTGKRIPGFAQTFGVLLDQKSYAFSANLIESSVPGNVLWPEEQPTFTIQLVNNTDQPIAAKGKADVVEYGTRGRPGDVWVPDMFKIADVGSTPIDVNLPAKGFADIQVSPKIPAKFGAYGLVVDLGPSGRQFATSCVRTFAASPKRIQYPHFCLDAINLDVLKRLGVQAVRHGIGYKVTTDKDFEQWFEREGTKLKDFQDANIAVLFMIGAGDWMHPCQPLGRPRPWLDDDAVMKDTKTDIAWMPSYDGDFQKFCKLFASTYGWPKGPINAFSLWNEPWEGISISGWGADMPRYREIFAAMCLGVEEARHQGAQILLGGCDSTSNAMDKLFGDGQDTFMKWFDFVSIHYQGMDPRSTVKAWVNRQHPNGRVRIWDTESWVANTDDRVAAVVAVNRSAGYDRAMGIFGGNIAEERDYQRRLADGKSQRIKTVTAWSVAASVGATTHFIGEREFKEILFKNGLPWVYVFDGLAGADGKANPEDGTIVVVGDIGEEFGHDHVLFRTARGLKEVEHKEQLKRQLAALPGNAPEDERRALEQALKKAETLSGATMTIAAGDGRFALDDFYGNPVPPQDGKIVIPLDGRGFFLRGDGSPGAFDQLVKAVQTARVRGIEPLATVCHDLTARIEQKPTLRLSLTNIYNRPMSGMLTVSLGNLKLETPTQALTFAGNETKEVRIKVMEGTSTPNNTYPLSLVFDAGDWGKAVHEEEMHVNVIARRTISVNGKLDDWKDVLPQVIAINDAVRPTLMESAWQPFKTFDASVKTGFATGYLAYDDKYFYFAAKVADSTPYEGTVRFETRNDDEYYYPEVSYAVDREKTLAKREVVWEPSTNDKRALQKPEGAGRLAAAWTTTGTGNTFAVDLKLPKDKLTQVALYFLDNEEGRSVKVTAIDPATEKKLDERDIRDYRFGKYAVYNLSGDVRLKIRSNSWRDGALSGIFFDVAKGDIKGPGDSAKFLRFDDDTEGSWKGVYGADGYHVIGTEPKYPGYAQVSTPEVIEKTALKWPEGVRRYSYRKDPVLPAGNAMPNFDNIQIAFNVVPPEAKPWYPCPPGTMPGYIFYKDTDYEYALNQVSPKYGGGFEIWRMEVPGMPHKHFYPRQGKSPFDGAVKDGLMVTTREGNTRITEAAIPWTEIPEAKKCLDEGRAIKFSFRVNDVAGGGCMELSKGRSVAKRNTSFHNDWTEHWANEVEFAFEKP